MTKWQEISTTRIKTPKNNQEEEILRNSYILHHSKRKPSKYKEYLYSILYWATIYGFYSICAYINLGCRSKRIHIQITGNRYIAFCSTDSKKV